MEVKVYISLFFMSQDILSPRSFFSDTFKNIRGIRGLSLFQRWLIFQRHPSFFKLISLFHNVSMIFYSCWYILLSALLSHHLLLLHFLPYIIAPKQYNLLSNIYLIQTYLRQLFFYILQWIIYWIFHLLTTTTIVQMQCRFFVHVNYITV